MKKHIIPLLVFCILLTSNTLNATPIEQQQITDEPLLATGITIYVDDSNTQGPWNGTRDYPYQYIRDGILHATDEDTVYVFNGLYNETVTVNKSIYFRGQQQANTIIDGSNNGSVVHITNPNVTMRRLTVRNAGGNPGDAGILIHAQNITITECTIYRTYTGLLVQHSSDITITDSQFHTNGYGIYLSTSSYITIDLCIFYHNGIGVYLSDIHCTTITNSYADTNGIGFLGEQSSNIYLTHSAARDNDDNEGGMFFSKCSYIEINNCNLDHNGVGVNIINSSICYIDHCTFTLNTHFACKLKEALSGIIITNSLFTENLRYAVHTEKSSLTLSWSNLYNNTLYALYAPSSNVNAQYTWWGFRTGPAHTGLGIADRGTWNHRSITYTPWLTFPMPEVGANWKIENIFQKPTTITPWPEHIVFPDQDTDDDGAPDWWEDKWGYNPAVPENHTLLDPDGDGLNNIEECYTDVYTSNPFHKDVFLEFDWAVSSKPNVTNKPQNEEIDLMIAAFAAHNITLHVDVGNLGGGEEIPVQSFVSYSDVVELYWRYFLHHDLNNPRQRIFHYGLICDYSEGPGFAVVGWDQLSSFVIGAQYLVDNFPRYSREWLITTASMHETGHTFGLVASTYPGIDNRGTLKIYNKEFLFYIHYKSLMNYLYTWSFMDYSDGNHGRGDFNDWENLDFSFFKNTRFEYPPT